MTKLTPEQIKKRAETFCDTLKAMMINAVDENREVTLQDEPYTYVYDFDGFMRFPKPVGKKITITIKP